MSDILSREQRIELAETALNEGRISQGFWRNNGNNGREMVCALAAFGPDINGSGDCPADLMPQWLAKLVPSIDDGIKLDEVPWFAGGLIERARKWHVLDDAAWGRIRTGFLIAAIKHALQSAEPVQPDPKPAYWKQVTDACEQVISALEAGGDLKAAATAATAAAAASAAYAADAAVYAADAAVAAVAVYADAADAAVYAAVYAADAASADAASADASAAARSSSWWRIAETLFALIDIELGEVSHG
jgi:hypothetical protein